MRSHILVITIAALSILAACNNNSAPDQGELSKLMHEKDSLNQEMEKISTRLEELNGQIAMVDTTKKLLIVTTNTVPITKFEHYFEVQGNIEADKNAVLFPEASGAIKKITVSEGQKVQKGQVLMELDASVVRSNIKEAETAYDLANTTYEKQSRLWKDNIGSEIQYLQAKTNKESAEARLASLRAQLDKLTIEAPFNGIVDEIFPKLGELASPQLPVVRIVNLDEVYVKSEVSEAYINRISQGTEVKIKLPDTKELVSSSIDLIGNYINPNNRTFKIRVGVENTVGNLKPNLLTKVMIKDYERDSSVVLPERIIQQTPAGEDFIYLVERKNNSVYVRKKAIKTGLSYQNMVVVKEGLQGGEEFIERGSRSVKDGQRVEIAG